MRSKPSNRRKYFSKPAHPGLIFVAFLGINIINLAFVSAFTSVFDEENVTVAINDDSTKTLAAKKIVKPRMARPTPTPAAAPPKPVEQLFTHIGIATTVFWVGEDATADNNNIHNHSSAWVEDWLAEYGGVDSPTERNGYLPAGFTPKENPFYVALPYNDLDNNGIRKPTATKCGEANTKSSWCKNSWVAIGCHGKIAYGQWQDAGPNGEDDVNYVFGSATPLNQFGTKSGLDVSPAIRDYLGMGGNNKCDWTFISYTSVPDGPWKIKITSTPSYEVSQ